MLQKKKHSNKDEASGNTSTDVSHKNPSSFVESSKKKPLRFNNKKKIFARTEINLSPVKQSSKYDNIAFMQKGLFEDAPKVSEMTIQIPKVKNSVNQ